MNAASTLFPPCDGSVAMARCGGSVAMARCGCSSTRAAVPPVVCAAITLIASALPIRECVLGGGSNPVGQRSQREQKNNLNGLSCGPVPGLRPLLNDTISMRMLIQAQQQVLLRPHNLAGNRGWHAAADHSVPSTLAAQV